MIKQTRVCNGSARLSQLTGTACVYRVTRFAFALFYFLSFWIIQVTTQPVINRKCIPFRSHLQSMGGGVETE
jgi:hypothetical protein